MSDSNIANGGSATGPDTSGSLIYVTSLQGSTKTISNVTGTAATLTQALGLTGGMAAGGNLVVGGTATASGSDLFVTGGTALTSSTSALITLVQTAITTMTNAASTLATNAKIVDGMASYSSNLSDSLTSGVGALTDADMAAESAKLTSLQTKQSLAISSLSVAKSSSQNILTLFR